MSGLVDTRKVQVQLAGGVAVEVNIDPRASHNPGGDAMVLTLLEYSRRITALEHALGGILELVDGRRCSLDSVLSRLFDEDGQDRRVVTLTEAETRVVESLRSVIRAAREHEARAVEAAENGVLTS